jgi:hypothetical protein
VDCGIIVEKDRGLNEKEARIFWLGIYFLIGNVVDSVHGSWTAAPVSSPWTKDMAMVGSLLELLLPADSDHGSPMPDGERKRVLQGFNFTNYRGLGGGEGAAHQRWSFSSGRRRRGCSRE